MCYIPRWHTPMIMHTTMMGYIYCRFLEPEQDSSVLDILWSDPYLDDDLVSMSEEQYRDFMDVEWEPNPRRGCSYLYGYKIVKSFLEKVISCLSWCILWSICSVISWILVCNATEQPSMYHPST